MVENCKHVRVDNWGIFFLQRLQMFFSKTDYCDLTLQFEGNVQLKVHRLVVNACTEFFQVLESCQTAEESVLIMPKDLQADVIVPIVNFMYTGTLQFQISLLDKLYKAAETMNITVLTKLLDAQKQPKQVVKKTVITATTSGQTRKVTPATSKTNNLELPKTLPGLKVPVWKRKKLQIPSTPSAAFSQIDVPHNYNYKKDNVSNIDPLSFPDNTPKPTRFEWDDEELSNLGFIDNSFEGVSYTSKPLLTQEYENKAGPSFDDIKYTTSENKYTYSSSKKDTSQAEIDIDEMQDYVKEQRIRSGLTQQYTENDENTIKGVKRKTVDLKLKATPKKVRFEEKQPPVKSDLDHQKIISEILKKYPQLVKKNKNIRLKIMAKGPSGGKSTETSEAPKLFKTKTTVKQPLKTIDKTFMMRDPLLNDNKSDQMWVCNKCSTPGEPVEFMLYYLYRKHMSDIHEEKFDELLCKYCGQKCTKHNLLMYHLYTKHGLKPPSAYVFPKCNSCPYIALTEQILHRHKLKHNKNEKLCIECCLAFSNKQTLLSHVQITGHNGRTGRLNFDCQYCTKRYQSGVNLFSHIRIQHRNEARCDGIVSIDEPEEFDDLPQQSQTSEDEYIVPEIIASQALQKDKVKILSDIKVGQESEVNTQQASSIKLEPSSEAEALSNVASGIATSLGLVDIVVLNENQQYILQSDQSTIVAAARNENEYILPDMNDDTNKFTTHQGQNEHNVLAQGMIPTGDIGSTDELVMVLTDHDYGDGQNEITGDNSNIVVLYSHPVDGQQGQFITSQNLTVNSQTGMIEIRNGAITTTASSNQLIMTDSVESPIESIELIQQEVDGHNRTAMKPVNLYEHDKGQEQPQLDEQQQQQEEEDESDNISNTGQTNQENVNVGKKLDLPDSSSLDNTPTESDFIIIEDIPCQISKEQLANNDDDDDNNKVVTETTNTTNVSEENLEKNEENIEEPPNNQQEKLNIDNQVDALDVEPAVTDEFVEPEKSPLDEVDCAKSVETTQNSEVYQEEPMEIDEDETPKDYSQSPTTIASPKDSQDNILPSEERENEFSQPSQDVMPVLTSEIDKNDVEGHDVPPEGLERSPPRLEIEEAHSSDAEVQIENDDRLPKIAEEEEEQENVAKPLGETDEYLPEPMEVDGKIESFDEVDKAEKPKEQCEDNEVEYEGPPVENEQEDTSENIEKPAENEPAVEHVDDSQLATSETSTSQFNDEHSEISQDSEQTSSERVQENTVANPENTEGEVSSKESNRTTKISILDDWDDTDSQQSGEAEAAIKEAGETVNKLMDEWEEEDEDENNKRDVDE